MAPRVLAISDVRVANLPHTTNLDAPFCSFELGMARVTTNTVRQACTPGISGVGGKVTLQNPALVVVVDQPGREPQLLLQLQAGVSPLPGHTCNAWHSVVQSLVLHLPDWGLLSNAPWPADSHLQAL